MLKKIIYIAGFFITLAILWTGTEYVYLKRLYIYSPVPSTSSVLDNVYARLYKVHNAYKLNNQSFFIKPANASTEDTKAKAYIAVDNDNGNILDSYNEKQQLPIASLTKIMTAVVALDLASPDERFTVTQNAADQIPTKIGIQTGEQMTLRELLHASLMTSANDATEEIKEGIDTLYGTPVFIDATNKKAELIGLTSTHFSNPQGFDSDHNYSTVSDLAVLAHYALTEYPMIEEIVRKDHLVLPADQYHHQFDLYNWNGLLDVYPGVYGIKIGNTGQAGTTTIVGSRREGKNVLVVVLGTPNVLERDKAAATLLDNTFENEWKLEPVRIEEDSLREKYASWHLY